MQPWRWKGLEAPTCLHLLQIRPVEARSLVLQLVVGIVDPGHQEVAEGVLIGGRPLSVRPLDLGLGLSDDVEIRGPPLGPCSRRLHEHNTFYLLASSFLRTAFNMARRWATWACSPGSC